MVLLVLAIVWGVLLVSWLRSRTEGTFYDSVGTFRRHLSVLERAAPATMAPANRLRSGPIAGRVVSAYRPAPARLTGRPVAGIGRRPATAAALRRRQTQKRRRDVFFALLAGVVGSFLLAMIPGLSIMWSVQVLFDLMLAGYVALLIRIRNLAAERELKLTFMPPPARVARSRPAYDLGTSGYGDVGLRRAAN
ncbi:MAG TPA: hypothetical protein VGL49_07005 [Acidimicrobiales bacterium]